MFVSAVNSYSRQDDFWFKYSEPTGKNGDGLRKRFTWTKILTTLKKTRKEVDIWDAERVKRLYKDPKMFAEHFSYRKGNKLTLLKSVSHIARQLRKIEGSPRFWDYADEEEDCIEL